MPRVYKHRTVEERILSLTPHSLQFLENAMRNKIKVGEGTKLSIVKLILSMRLDKDKREGKSTSSYEGQLMGIRGKKK